MKLTDYRVWYKFTFSFFDEAAEDDTNEHTYWSRDKYLFRDKGLLNKMKELGCNYLECEPCVNGVEADDLPYDCPFLNDSFSITPSLFENTSLLIDLGIIPAAIIETALHIEFDCENLFTWISVWADAHRAANKNSEANKKFALSKIMQALEKPTA